MYASQASLVQRCATQAVQGLLLQAGVMQAAGIEFPRYMQASRVGASGHESRTMLNSPPLQSSSALSGRLGMA